MFTPDTPHDPTEYVPEGQRLAAEQVRAHLVYLRGGAPFLSSNDALLLVRWLDEKVPVPLILAALERAAEARAKRASKVPLALTHAKRHLGKLAPAHPRVAQPEQLPQALREDGEDELAGLLAELAGVGQDQFMQRALEAIRTFIDARWLALPEGERQALRHQARQAVSDQLALVDEGTGEVLIEERARYYLRERWPYLSAATLWRLVSEQEAP